jgi:hypothetical protein
MLEQEMWISLRNFTWNGEDDTSKAWNKVHMEVIFFLALSAVVSVILSDTY